jgi:quercetin dioxygenase-like cupin family protein
LGDHEISGEVLLLDFAEESVAILDAARATTVGHTAKTLVKEGPLRIVILGMKVGAILREHEAAGPVSVHILSGQVTVSSQDRADSLKAGNALVFGSSVNHSLEAQADSVALLTIAWPAT